MSSSDKFKTWWIQIQ